MSHYASSTLVIFLVQVHMLESTHAIVMVLHIWKSPAYGVYISQLIRYARAYSLCVDFIDRGRLLTKKLVVQGYTLEKYGEE